MSVFFRYPEFGRVGLSNGCKCYREPFYMYRFTIKLSAFRIIILSVYCADFQMDGICEKYSSEK